MKFRAMSKVLKHGRLHIQDECIVQVQNNVQVNYSM